MEVELEAMSGSQNKGKWIEIVAYLCGGISELMRSMTQCKLIAIK